MAKLKAQSLSRGRNEVMRDWVRIHAVVAAVLVALVATPAAGQVPTPAPAVEAPAPAPEWMQLRRQALAEASKAFTAHIQNGVPAKVAYSAALDLDRKTERAAAKAMGEGSPAHQLALGTLAAHLGLAGLYADQLITAKRLFALQTKGVSKTDARYAEALANFASNLTYYEDKHRPIGEQALAQAKTVLATLPLPADEATAQAWNWFAIASPGYGGAVEDQIHGRTVALDYWTAQKPLQADRTFMMAESLAMAYLRAENPLGVVKARERASDIARADPRPDHPLLGEALLRQAQAMAELPGPPNTVDFYRANALFMLSGAIQALEEQKTKPGLLKEAQAERDKILAYQAERRVARRTERTAAALAAAGQKGDVVATPGLAAVMAKLKSQGVNLEGGAK